MSVEKEEEVDAPGVDAPGVDDPEGDLADDPEAEASADDPEDDLANDPADAQGEVDEAGNEEANAPELDAA